MPHPAIRRDVNRAALDRAERALAALRGLKTETAATFPGEMIPGRGSLMDDVPDALDTIETKLRAVIARIHALPADEARRLAA